MLNIQLKYPKHPNPLFYAVIFPQILRREKTHRKVRFFLSNTFNVSRETLVYFILRLFHVKQDYVNFLLTPFNLYKFMIKYLKAY